MSESEWTCEGKPKSAWADCRGDGIQPLLWNMYDRTWLRAFLNRMNIGGTAGEFTCPIN